MIKKSLCLVGCGKMGGALLTAWQSGIISPSQITVIEPDVATARALQRQFSDIHISDRLANHKPDIIIFAVKPDTLTSILPEYRQLIARDTLFISIAAGKTLHFFKQHLGMEASVIRAMPNLPAMVSKGVTVLCKNEAVRIDQQDITTELFQAVGSCRWEKESLMDAVTALSGSGPAYVFLMAEAMTNAGIAIGLPPELAKTLAIETIYGSAAFLATSESSPSELREQVTSPKGTTAAALAILMNEPSGISSLMEKALKAAYQRSRELAE